MHCHAELVWEMNAPDQLIIVVLKQLFFIFCWIQKVEFLHDSGWQKRLEQLPWSFNPYWVRLRLEELDQMAGK